MAAGPESPRPRRSLWERGQEAVAARQAANPAKRGISATSKKKLTEAEQKRVAARVAHRATLFADAMAAKWVGESPALLPDERSDISATLVEVLEDSRLFGLLYPYILPIVLFMIVAPITWRLWERKKQIAAAKLTAQRYAATAPHPTTEDPHAAPDQPVYSNNGSGALRGDDWFRENLPSG